MKRGEIWTISGAGYAGKPRPAVIVHDARIETASLTVCPLTSDPTEAPLARVPVSPSPGNGLREASRLMVDKLVTIRKEKLGRRIGTLDPEDMVRLNRALIVFLGLA